MVHEGGIHGSSTLSRVNTTTAPDWATMGVPANQARTRAAARLARSLLQLFYAILQLETVDLAPLQERIAAELARVEMITLNADQQSQEAVFRSVTRGQPQQRQGRLVYNTSGATTTQFNKNSLEFDAFGLNANSGIIDTGRRNNEEMFELKSGNISLVNTSSQSYQLLTSHRNAITGHRKQAGSHHRAAPRTAPGCPRRLPQVMLMANRNPEVTAHVFA
ncbi:MAG: hypothetical protein WC661_01425 [Opitutaceae bacterium]|jgi:hypothetical protein